MTRSRQLGAALAAGLLSLCAPQARAQPSPIQVVHAWSRPIPAGLPTGVIYLTVDNRGGAPDRLTGASTPIAQRMTLHRTTMKAGIMSMQAIPTGLEIPARGEVRLEPAGYHFMLVGLKRGLAAGAHFPATLTFAHAPPQTVEVTVRDTPLEPPMAGMKMDGASRR